MGLVLWCRVFFTYKYIQILFLSFFHQHIKIIKNTEKNINLIFFLNKYIKKNIKKMKVILFPNV